MWWGRDPNRKASVCFSLPRKEKFTDPADKPSPLTAIVGAFQRLGERGSDMETKAGGSGGLLQQITSRQKSVCEVLLGLSAEA